MNSIGGYSAAVPTMIVFIGVVWVGEGEEVGVAEVSVGVEGAPPPQAEMLKRRIKTTIVKKILFINPLLNQFGIKV
jgi:hypothetical protein